ncbi:MAG: DNA gyrase C-terminal beta-propeller domain-containing protein [bacterium]
MIRMKVSDIRVISRVTQGVRLIALDEGDALVSATTVEPEDEEPSELVPTDKPGDQ